MWGVRARTVTSESIHLAAAPPCVAYHLCHEQPRHAMKANGLAGCTPPREPLCPFDRPYGRGGAQQGTGLAHCDHGATSIPLGEAACQEPRGVRAGGQHAFESQTPAQAAARANVAGLALHGHAAQRETGKVTAACFSCRLDGTAHGPRGDWRKLVVEAVSLDASNFCDLCLHEITNACQKA